MVDCSVLKSKNQQSTMLASACVLCLGLSSFSAKSETSVYHHAKHSFDEKILPTPDKPRVAVLSAYYGTSLKLANVTRPNKQGYASQHGYYFEDAYAQDSAVQTFIDDALSKGEMSSIEDQSAKYVRHVLVQYTCSCGICK
eukprot:m.151735 g.151735  ORF g.151735 m.151735 type:complete len:141 (-) comp17873_c0_seq2:97-519(-)